MQVLIHVSLIMEKNGAAEPDPMDLDDDELDLLAALDEAVAPVDPGEMIEEDEEEEEAEPLIVEATVEKEAAPNDPPLPHVPIEHVLGRYAATVAVPLAQFDKVCQLVDIRAGAVAQRIEVLFALARPTGDERVNSAREEVLLAIADWREATKEERLMMQLCRANMELLVSNEMLGHLARSPQEAPYRTAESIEPTEIGFATDNPQLPMRQTIPVATVRPRMV